ncbi:MAG: hypothetical protein SO069_01615, partial [Succinivibrio sp.]|nr:hypothetical protein [Succinivibrio sp.]
RKISNGYLCLNYINSIQPSASFLEVCSHLSCRLYIKFLKNFSMRLVCIAKGQRLLIEIEFY